MHAIDAKNSLKQLMPEFHWYNLCQKSIDTIDRMQDLPMYGLVRNLFW
jgi:hypothetical protein